MQFAHIKEKCYPCKILYISGNNTHDRTETNDQSLPTTMSDTLDFLIHKLSNQAETLRSFENKRKTKIRLMISQSAISQKAYNETTKQRIACEQQKATRTLP